MSFELPTNAQLTDSSGRASVPFLSWLTNVHTTVTAVRQSGTTAQRPTTLVWVGRVYFDTTLGIPIWAQSVGPIVWCDATGAAV